YRRLPQPCRIYHRAASLPGAVQSHSRQPAHLANSNFCTTAFGDLGRNTYRGPGQVNFDFSLIKTFRITEPPTLQFTTSFFNLWHHPNSANPSVTDVESIGLANSPFGKITSSLGTPRLIQFALRYSF